MTVIDLSIVAGRSDHLNDEIIWQTQLAAEPTIDTEESTEGCLARLSLRLLQYLLDIGLGDAAFLRLDQRENHPAHRIGHALVASHHGRSHRFLAQPFRKNRVLRRIREPRTGSSQLCEIRGHAGAATLQVAADHLIQILIFDRGVRQLTRLKNVIEVLLGGGA